MQHDDTRVGKIAWTQPLVSANAETQRGKLPALRSLFWIPAYAGMSGIGLVAALVIVSSIFATSALAASGRRPAPPGAFDGAPAEYTRFTVVELSRGFLSLAFGSDLRLGAKPKGIRRFDRPLRAQVIPGGSVDRVAAVERILREYAEKVPALQLTIVPATEPADLAVRLIDEKYFAAALEAAFGRATARTFVAKTDPQCMTSLKSRADGEIIHADSFIIVDQGDDVFLDCVYHELLHAFGLSNHDSRNSWTTLNQQRMVGYLTVYDRALLTALYDRRITPGLSRAEVVRILPRLFKGLEPVRGPIEER